MTMNTGNNGTGNDDAEGVLDTSNPTILVSPGDLPRSIVVRNAAA